MKKAKASSRSESGKAAWAAKSPAERQQVLDRLARARKARGKR
jgi:predicted Fe-S protein YdhL (DUF1289 family)